MNNIPEGYKLVPVEPTEEMQIAGGRDQGFCSTCGYDNGGGDPAYTYADMIAAAPAPPQPIYDEVKERELLEAYCAKVGLPLDTLPSGEYLIPVTRFVSQGWHARAKAGEDE